MGNVVIRNTEVVRLARMMFGMTDSLVIKEEKYELANGKRIIGTSLKLRTIMGVEVETVPIAYVENPKTFLVYDKRVGEVIPYYSAVDAFKKAVELKKLER